MVGCGSDFKVSRILCHNRVRFAATTSPVGGQNPAKVLNQCQYNDVIYIYDIIYIYVYMISIYIYALSVLKSHNLIENSVFETCFSHCGMSSINQMVLFKILQAKLSSELDHVCEDLGYQKSCQFAMRSLS